MTHPDPKTTITPLLTVDGHQRWRETQRWSSGMVRSRNVVADPWGEEKWETCFCCTCDVVDAEGNLVHTMNDPCCRNHGYDFGTRPCDIHNTPGKPYTEEMGERAGTMPLAVSLYREATANGTVQQED